MSKRTKDIILLASGIVITLLLGLYIQATSGYTLAFREQQQLFLYNASYINGLIWNVGGVAVITARFLVQFFFINGLGAVITALLLGLTAWLVWLIMRKAECSWQLFPLCFLPSLFIAISLLDDYFNYQGLVAYVFGILFLYIYVSIFNRNKWKGLILAILLYFIAGAIALLFAVAAFIYDILAQGIKKSISWIFIIAVLILGFISVQKGDEGIYAYVFTPSGYCDHSMRFLPVHHLSWAMLIVSILLSWGLNKLKVKNIYLKSGVCLLLIIISATCFLKTYNKNLSATNERLYKLDYYAANCDWNKILQQGHEINNYLEGNYVNLALAEKGHLTEMLFDYPQNSPLSLICYTKDKQYIQLVACARVLFSMGNIAGAQSLASNTDQAKNGHNPSMLKMLAESEIIRGNYTVAKKYLDVLADSWHYADWANAQRKYLFNDKLVMSNSLYANGRRDLPKQEDFVLFKTPMDDLYKILDTNPTDKKAMQYALSYLLLAKDVNNTQGFIDRYYGKPALKTLPTCAQEALIFCSNYYRSMKEDFALEHGMSKETFENFQKIDSTYCRNHGVTDETMNRFDEFQNDYRQSGNNPSTLARYSNTFWYYLFFM
jgi:hypothetical protein